MKGFVVRVECCWLDEFSWSYPPAKLMPSTAMLDLESYGTGGIGG